MLSKLVTAAFIVSQATSIFAHGGVTSYSVGGTTYPGATSGSIACNNGGGTGNPNQQSITLAAGSQITAYWPQWTHREGPVTVYLSKCPGSTCTGVSNNGVKWFKIQEVGLISGTVYTGTWGNGVVVDTLKWTTTIPANLQPGAYFIRHELLALHQANAPQFYPECAQLIITGSGTDFPSGDYLVSIPGAWTASDPGVNINIYGDAAKTQTSYPVPGPPVWPAGSGPGTSVVPPISSSTTKVSTAIPTTTKVSTTSSSSPTPTTGGTAAHYGQCGGIGWAGPTVCESPYTCKKSGDYYSQCL